MKSLEHMSIRELAFFVTIMSIVWIAAMLFFGVIEDADIYSIIIVSAIYWLAMFGTAYIVRKNRNNIE